MDRVRESIKIFNQQANNRRHKVNQLSESFLERVNFVERV